MEDKWMLKRLKDTLFQEGIDNIQNKIFSFLDIYGNQTIATFIGRHVFHKNCSNCINYNYGRMYWICNKGHSIKKDSGKSVVEYPNDGEHIIFIQDTYANNGCPDYDVRRRKDSYMTLIKCEGKE